MYMWVAWELHDGVRSWWDASSAFGIGAQMEHHTVVTCHLHLGTCLHRYGCGCWCSVWLECQAGPHTCHGYPGARCHPLIGPWNASLNCHPIVRAYNGVTNTRKNKTKCKGTWNSAWLKHKKKSSYHKICGNLLECPAEPFPHNGMTSCIILTYFHQISWHFPAEFHWIFASVGAVCYTILNTTGTKFNSHMQLLNHWFATSLWYFWCTICEGSQFTVVVILYKFGIFFQYVLLQEQIECKTFPCGMNPNSWIEFFFWTFITLKSIEAFTILMTGKNRH